jgi:hypothetical protein
LKQKRKSAKQSSRASPPITRLARTATDHPASQQGAEEDFSWDDEVDPDSASVTDAPVSQTTPTPTPSAKSPLPVPTVVADATTPKAAPVEKMPSQPATSLPSKAANTSTSTSPRDSEESYDLVSDQKKSAAQTEDDDSDWE